MTNEVVMPCGCKRELVKRQAPAFDPETGAPKMENGAFVMEEVEEIQEIFCDEHTIKIIERQQEMQKALASGTPLTEDEVLQLTAGASPFPQLGDGSDEG